MQVMAVSNLRYCMFSLYKVVVYFQFSEPLLSCIVSEPQQFIAPIGTKWFYIAQPPV